MPCSPQPFRGPGGISHLVATCPCSLSTQAERSLLGTVSETAWKELPSFFQGKRSSSGPPAPPWQAGTSVGMLGTEPVKPFSAMVLWELLGELGPEPGALLHTDDTTGEVAVTWACLEPPLLPDPQNRDRRRALTPRPGPCDLNSSLLKGANDGPILATQKGTASPLSHLLL